MEHTQDMSKVQNQAQNQTPPGSRSRREPIPTGTTRILLVILKGLQSQVSVEGMFWIFSQFGVVEKLSSFSKNSKSQLLIQYETQDHAGVALSYLNGRDITLPTGTTCRLEIVPSFLRVLTFKKLDSRNRDYTSLNNEIRSVYPLGIPGKAIENGWYARDFLWGKHIMGEGWLYPPQEAHQCGTIPKAATTAGGLPQGEVGDCVKLSGLNETEINAEKLFRIASMYGEVVSAKMMAKRKGCALVQFTNKSQADQAIAKLDGINIFGSQWEAVPSKHANALHWDGAGTELQTRMCTVNDIQRPDVPAADIAGPPSHYLGILGITEEEEAAELLREALKGYNPAEVSPMGGDHPAVAGFEYKEQAFLAAASINGQTVNGQRISVYFIETPSDAAESSDTYSEVADEAEHQDTYRIKTDDYFGARPRLDDDCYRQRTL